MCCDACSYRGILFPVGFLGVMRVPEIDEASIAVNGKSMGHRMVDRSSNEADFLFILDVFSMAVTEKY
jgi:hypothetical protein